MSAAITTLGKLVVADDSGFSTNAFRLDFIDFDPGVTLELLDMNGTRGKFTRDDARVRHNRTTVFPRLRCQPTAVELSNILKWAMGGTPSGSPTVTYPLGDAAPERYVWYKPDQGTGWKLASVAVDAMTVSSSSGEPLSVDLELVGKDYTFTGASFPSTALDLTTRPYIFSDLALTTSASTRLVREMTFSLRNNIDRSRFLNSLTLTAINKLHREVAWAINVPAGDYDSDWNTALTNGVAAVATWTGPGTQVLSMTSNAVRFVPRNAQVPFRMESFIRREGEAFSDDGTNESVVITHHE